MKTLYHKNCIYGTINFEDGTDEKKSMEIMAEVKDKITEELFAMEEKCRHISFFAAVCLKNSKIFQQNYT